MTTPERLNQPHVAWWKTLLPVRALHPKAAVDKGRRRWRRGLLLSVPAVVACVLVAMIVVCQPPGHAQVSSGYGGGYGEEYEYGGGEYSDYGSAGVMAGGMSGQADRQQLQFQVDPLLKRLREARSEDQKAEIKRELSGVLENHFNEDMQWRLKEMDSIQERVQRLRDDIERRRDAKDEILELQLKLLENEAAGLGFFRPRSAGAAMGGMNPGMMDMGGMSDMGSMRGMEMGGFGGDEGGEAMGPGSMGGMEMGGYGEGGEGYGMGMDPYYPGPPPIPLAFQKRTKIQCVETPLSEAVDTLRDASQSNIYLDRLALSNAGVKLETPINVTIADISVAMGLALIVDSVGGKLGVRFDDGVAVVSERQQPLIPGHTRWGHDGSQASRQAAQSLGQTGDYQFAGDSLDVVLGTIQDMSGAPVFLHRRTLEEAGVSPQAHVTIRLKSVKHRTALRLILDSVDRALYFSILDGVVIVAAAPPSEEEYDGYGMFEDELPADAGPGVTRADDGALPDEPAAGLPIGDAVVGDVSLGGAEEVDICELAFKSATDKLKLVETGFLAGETSALTFREAEAERDIAERRLAQAKRRYSAQEQLLKLDLQQAELELEMAKASFDEAMELNEQGALSRAELRDKQAAYRSAQLALTRAETLLNLHLQPEPIEATDENGANPTSKD